MIRTIIFCISLTSAGLLPAFCQAALTFNVTYADVTTNSNQGFDDPTLGADRRATFQSALDYISNQLSPTAYNATIDYQVNASETDGSGFLASAGTFWFNAPARFDNGFFYEHASTGVDPAAGFTDASAVFDFGYNWNSQTDAPTGGEFDLFTVALHEVTHSMGFLSLVSPAGTSNISGGDPGVFTVFDSMLERGDGTALFGATGDFLGTATDLTSGDVFFDGANARAANGGNPIELFAPGTFQNGSSISHIDPAFNAVMNPALPPGTTKRDWTALDRGILTDIGWQVVPEPNAAAAVFSLLLAATRIRSRRRRA